MKHPFTLLSLLVILAITSCTPQASPSLDLSQISCKQDPAPVVAVIDFENTTGRFGVTVTGVETAATARLITLLKQTGCYTVVEKSVLQDIIAKQGLESLDPQELAKAAGAGYVITGTVTRATIDRPQVRLAGVSVGALNARVEVDVRATDIITGQVEVSMTGIGEASNSNLAVSNLPVGTIAFDSPEYGPLLADASETAVIQVVGAIVQRF